MKIVCQAAETAAVAGKCFSKNGRKSDPKYTQELGSKKTGKVQAMNKQTWVKEKKTENKQKNRMSRNQKQQGCWQ